jgi:hypothetical protein
MNKHPLSSYSRDLLFGVGPTRDSGFAKARINTSARDQEKLDHGSTNILLFSYSRDLLFGVGATRGSGFAKARINTSARDQENLDHG